MIEKPTFPVPLADETSPSVPRFAAPAAPEETPRPGASAEPLGLLDLVEPDETYGVDEVTLLARDPFTLFAHWETTADGREAARRRLGAEGALVLRLAVTGAGGGPIIDETLPRDFGRGYLPAPYPGALVAALIGLRAADGRFEPIATAPLTRVPHSEQEDGRVEWLEIAPARTRGRELERPVAVPRGAAADVPGAARRAGVEARTFPGAGPTSPAAPAGGPAPGPAAVPAPPGVPTSPGKGWR